MHEATQQPDTDGPKQVDREDGLEKLDHSGHHYRNTSKHKRPQRHSPEKVVRGEVKKLFPHPRADDLDWSDQNTPDDNLR